MIPPLSGPERGALLRLARAAIEERLTECAAVASTLERVEITAGLETRRGVFISLKQHGDARQQTLRGCIGTLAGSQPLYRAVLETAPKAATDDPRFSPMTAGELTEVRIEISALTPPERVSDPGSIVIGRDGLQLRAGARLAVFLPQVAVEQRWNVKRLLEQLSLKAGLPAGGWREPDAELWTFSAEVFRD